MKIAANCQCSTGKGDNRPRSSSNRVGGRKGGKEGREAVKMLAKETFACFYLFSLFGKRSSREEEGGKE